MAIRHVEDYPTMHYFGIHRHTQSRKAYNLIYFTILEYNIRFWLIISGNSGSDCKYYCPLLIKSLDLVNDLLLCYSSTLNLNLNWCVLVFQLSSLVVAGFLRWKWWTPKIECSCYIPTDYVFGFGFVFCFYVSLMGN